MKVVCDACHAKYQVPDERVAGRKLKIRCRRCSASIIVQGDALAEDLPLTSASEPPLAFNGSGTAPALRGGAFGGLRGDASSDGIEWHVSLDGEQHGPYPTAQMAGMLRGSQLDWDAYVWRESYGDWKSASDSDTLVRAVAAAADDEPTTAVPTPTEDPSPFDAENDPTRMAQTPAVEALMPVARTSFAARARTRSHTPENSLPRAPSQPPLTSAYVPRAASQPPLTASYVPRAASQPPSAGLARGYASEAASNRAYANEAATTRAYVSEAPVSRAYASEAPVSRAYASEAPVSRAYASEAPVSRAYASEAPVSRAYASEAPVDDAYGEEALSADAYVSEVPVYGAYAAAPAYSDRRGAHEVATAERHEDSVLFAAQNLSLNANAPFSPAPSPRSGYAAAEGSGLIDIRALAALARTNQTAHAPTNGTAHTSNGGNGFHASNGSYGSHDSNNGRSSDALLTLANQTGAFAHLDSLAPIDRPSSTPNKTVPIAILAGSMMIAAALLIGIYITRTPQTQPVAAASTVAPVALVPEPAAAPVAAAPTPAPAAEPVQAKAEVVEAKPAPVEPTRARSEPPARERVIASSTASGRSKSSAKSSRATKADVEPVAAAAKTESKKDKDKAPSIDDLVAAEKSPVAAKAEPAKEPSVNDDLLTPPKAPTRSRSIDELLDTAVVEGSKKPAAAAASADALPETPTRDQVKTAMAGVAAEVKACGDGQTLESNQAQAAVTVSGATGRVSAVRVTGAQGTVGSCVARAVREAVFPKFAKPSMSINYPFKLQ